MKKIVLLLIMFLSFYSFMDAAFETLSGGARSFGMGGAHLGVTRGGESSLLNPAGLGFFNKKIHFSSMYSPILLGLDDGSLYQASVNISTYLSKYGGFSLNVQYLGVDNNTVDNLYHELMGVLSYGRSLNKNLSLGLNCKYFKWQGAESIDFSGYTEQLGNNCLSFDFGLRYQVIDDITVGALITDFTHPMVSSDFALEKYQERIPVGIEMGLMFFFDKVMVAMDGEYKDRKFNLKTGGETWFWNNFFGLRGGLQFLNSTRGINFTAGMSFKIQKWVDIDYGFLFPLIGIKGVYGTHMISLNLFW